MNYQLAIILFFCAPVLAAPAPKLCGPGVGAIAIAGAVVPKKVGELVTCRIVGDSIDGTVRIVEVVGAEHARVTYTDMDGKEQTKLVPASTLHGEIAADTPSRRFPFHTPIKIGDREGLYLNETDTVVRVREGGKIVEWKKSELPPERLAALDKRGLDDAGREAAEASLNNPGWWPKKIRDLAGMTNPTLYRLKDGTLAVQKRYGERQGSSWKDDPVNEAVAYSVDKTLRLGVVPPCISNKEGAIQLYIEDANKGRWISKQEMALTDPIGAKRIRFLRSIIIAPRDKSETLVDAKGKIWTYDFSRDHGLQDTREITPERVLKDLPDYATYLHIKALEKAGYPSVGLELKGVLKKWISVVDPLIAEKGKDTLFPY